MLANRLSVTRCPLVNLPVSVLCPHKICPKVGDGVIRRRCETGISRSRWCRPKPHLLPTCSTAIAPSNGRMCFPITNRYAAAPALQCTFTWKPISGELSILQFRGRHSNRLAGSPRIKGSIKIHASAVHRFLEVFSRLEAYDLASADGRFPARLRVAPHASVLLPHLEGSEAPQNDRLAALERSLDGVDDCFDGFFSLDFAEARIVRHEVDDVVLRQRTPPPSFPDPCTFSGEGSEVENSRAPGSTPHEISI